jgi:2-iminobutanoate/2-iminopropanoate deaminase
MKGLFLILFKSINFMKKVILTDQAPAPIGPYSQAIAFNGLLFVSGQIGMNPTTGELILDNIEDETHQVLKNVEAILKAAGTGLDKVLKASVFVKDINMFGRINAVYATYFNTDAPPARELVQVAELPKFVNVEISVIATV